MLTTQNAAGLAAILLAAQAPLAAAQPNGNLTVVNYCNFPVFYSYNYTIINSGSEPDQQKVKAKREDSGSSEGIIVSGASDFVAFPIYSGQSTAALSLDVDNQFNNRFVVPIGFEANGPHGYNTTYKFQGNDGSKLEDSNMIIIANGTYTDGSVSACPPVVCKGGDKSCFTTPNPAEIPGSCPKPSFLRLELCSPVFLGNN